MNKFTVALCKREFLPGGKVKVTVHTKDGVQMTYYCDSVAEAYAQAQRDYKAKMMNKGSK